MIELMYPLEGPAPLVSPDRAMMTAAARARAMADGSAFPDGSEIFPVVQEDGTVTGRATREYCHGGSMLLHPVVHLHLIDRQERVYLQKRSMKKDIQPGKWDTAVGGHVIYGERIIEALHRESFEELSLTDYNPIYIGSYVYETGRDREFVNIFAAVGHFQVCPDHDEVDEGRWMTVKEVEKLASRGRLTPNFRSEFFNIKDKLLALL